MSKRIWRKNAINFQHCFILNLLKYVVTDRAKKNAINFQYWRILKLVKYVGIMHMAKKCNKFPTLFHFKVGEICRNAYGEKMQ